MNLPDLLPAEWRDELAPFLDAEATAALGVIATYHPSAAIRFGPAGAPLAGLREDLLSAAKATA